MCIEDYNKNKKLKSDPKIHPKPSKFDPKLDKTIRTKMLIIGDTRA